MAMSCYDWLLMIGFMASGIATPLLIGLLHRQGACGARTMLSVFPNYTVMTLTVCGDWAARHQGVTLWRMVTLATVVDAVSQGANYTGLILAGSATYILIYSSVTVWVAVFSRMFLGRVQTAPQWVGCVIVSVGVAITALNGHDQGSDVALGVLLVTLGSVGHSLAYILMEWNTAVALHPIAPSKLASLMGAGGFIIYGAYEFFYVLPRWDSLVASSIRAADGDAVTIAAAYGALLIAFWVHAFTFYALMTKLGATAAGVCKGLQAVGVLVASHVLFCDHDDRAQCFTPTKALSFAVVSVGVACFTAGAARAPTKPEGVALVPPTDSRSGAQLI